MVLAVAGSSPVVHPSILYFSPMVNKGKVVLKQREKSHKTQQQVAEVLHMSVAKYREVESGELGLTLQQIKTLARLFEVDYYDFLDALEIRYVKKDLEKMKQVVLYIINKNGSKPHFGETVLHKLLYFIDFDYYEKYEKSLMGSTYIKNYHGPTSKDLDGVIQSMEKSRTIKTRTVDYFGYKQKKYDALQEPDLSILSAQEIKHIDAELERFAHKNAKEIEEYSHGDIPWECSKDKQHIDYEFVFYRGEEYSVSIDDNDSL